MRPNQHGFTLIELLVGMVIVGFIFVGVGSMFQKQVATSISNKDETELQSSAQAALNMIASDIIAAGLGNPDLPFAITNVGGTTAGSDTLTLRSTFSINRGMNSHLSSNNVYSGSAIPARCWGQDGNGNGLRNPTRDITVVEGFTTYLLFVSVFDARPLVGVGANPAKVQEVLPNTGRCATDGSLPGTQNIASPLFDPVVSVVLDGASVSSLPRGTVIYAYLCPPCDGSNLPVITYSVNAATRMLEQSGRPILAGVEDFQVRFFSDPSVPGTPCPTGCDVLTGLSGVQIRLLNRVDLGLVVRSQHRDPHNIGDKRPNVVTLGHTLNLDAAAQAFSRKQFAYSVRPKNSSDFQ